jgi:hypothetical protein
LITYIKGGTPAQIYLEKRSAMMRATSFNVSYQNCCKKAYVNDSQNLAFATTFCNRVASL